MNKVNLSISFVLFPLILIAQNSSWEVIDEGLEIGEFEFNQKSIVGDSKVTIIKINPEFYSLTLLCCDEKKHDKLTAAEWCWKYDLIAVINAGMFLSDHRLNVGYMKNFEYLNNQRINSQYFSVVAFNPVDTTNVPFYIFDIDEDDMQEIISEYNTVIQNLRLIKRPAENRWSQQDRMWSEAVLGQDINGNILFIFSRSPYSMHDLINNLIDLPINLVCAQHLEGGPETSLFFSYNNLMIERMGSFETFFYESDDNKKYWPIPNVIGLKRK